MAEALNVHDLTASEQYEFNTRGGSTLIHRVTYYVGLHGPFVITGDSNLMTTAYIEAQIDARVAQLQALRDKYETPASPAQA